MSIKDILVHVGSAEELSAALRSAHFLSQQFDAHLTGLYVKNPIEFPVYADVNIPESVFDEARQYEQQRMISAKNLFERLTHEHRATVDWIEDEGRISTLLVKHSVCYDLVVVSHPGPDSETEFEPDITNRLVLEAGVPALIVPDHAPVGRFSRVLVAWNSSKESIRAVHNAIPFLSAADQVTIVSAKTPSNEDIPCADIARHLSRHGIAVEIEQTVDDIVDVGYWLESRLAGDGDDLLVMGAYGHSRYREMIFGGVTRHVLRSMPVPCLMSH